VAHSARRARTTASKTVRIVIDASSSSLVDDSFDAFDAFVDDDAFDDSDDARLVVSAMRSLAFIHSCIHSFVG